jgi:hypothetical protein
VDATAIEQVEITRLNLDLLLFNLGLCRVFVISAIGEVGLHLWTPSAPMYNSVRTIPIMEGILYTDESRELVCETGNLEVEELVVYSDVIDVRGVFVALIVNPKDSGTIEAPIGFAGDLHLLVHRQCGEAIVEGIHWIVKPVE